MARLPGVHAERTTPLIIVGAAILADGRLLACQRSEPPEVAGRWEFPGGKVEPGEDELEALVRECQEELGVVIRVLDRVGEDVPLAHGWALLRVWLAEIESGEPQALEHSALTWLGPDELDSVPWLPADAPIVAEVAKVLAAAR
jgi:8-oxo-dGTP diphosphatase